MLRDADDRGDGAVACLVGLRSLFLGAPRVGAATERAVVATVGVLGLVCAVATANASTPPTVVTVDCNQGQSLNHALAKLDKHTPTTVSVNGTCTESVQVLGFEGASDRVPQTANAGLRKIDQLQRCEAFMRRLVERLAVV